MDWTTRGSVVGWQLIHKYIWYQDFTKQQRHLLRNRSHQTCGALVLLSSDPWLIDDSCNMRKRSDFLCEIIQ